jgi:hypothetical protein
MNRSAPPAGAWQQRGRISRDPLRFCPVGEPGVSELEGTRQLYRNVSENKKVPS